LKLAKNTIKERRDIAPTHSQTGFLIDEVSGLLNVPLHICIGDIFFPQCIVLPRTNNSITVRHNGPRKLSGSFVFIAVLRFAGAAVRVIAHIVLRLRGYWDFGREVTASVTR
jgi:hypothetical protein